MVCQVGVGKRVCTIKVRVNLGALWLLYCTCAHTYMHIIKKECHQNEVGSIKSVHPSSAT